MSTLIRSCSQLGAALIDPTRAMRDAVERPRAVAIGVTIVTVGALLGVATLPRQMAVLGEALQSSNPLVESHYQVLRAGLLRLIWADRLVTSPGLVIAAAFVVLLAEPMLSLAVERKRVLASVAVLGLTPMLVQQVGELAVAYLTSLGAHPTPGDALNLPHGFSTGIKLFWGGLAPPPQWVELLDDRLNLVTLWSVFLWSTGLGALEGNGVRPVHVGIPLAAMVCAGTLTWIAGPTALALVLGGP
ncbi:MAG: hypothetical protein ACE5HT_01595 [Gemmatimonadales bacterium]